MNGLSRKGKWARYGMATVNQGIVILLMALSMLVPFSHISKLSLEKLHNGIEFLFCNWDIIFQNKTKQKKKTQGNHIFIVDEKNLTKNTE